MKLRLASGLLILLQVNAGFAQAPAPKYTIEAFPSSVAALDYLRVHTLPTGSPTSRSNLLWRSDQHLTNIEEAAGAAHDTPTLGGRIQDCRLFSSAPIRCKPQGVKNFWMLDQFEAVPAWLHLYIERTSQFGPAAAALGFYNTDITDGGHVTDPDVAPSGYQYRRDDAARIAPDEARPRRMRVLSGIKQQELWLYESGLDLVKSDYVIDADKAWNEILVRANDGQTVDCLDSLHLCAVVARITYPSELPGSEIYGVCHVRPNQQTLSMVPFNCRVIAYRQGDNRYLLSVRSVGQVEGLGAPYNGDLVLRGYKSAAEVRGLLIQSLQSLGLTRVDGPSGSIIAALSPTGTFDARADQFLWRNVTAVLERDDNEWKVTWAIYIFGSKRDDGGPRADRGRPRAVLRSDLIRHYSRQDDGNMRASEPR